jgi:hypothetical protein
MLEPIETWTRKSLQFQPPDTQPSGVSTQPFVPSTRRTTRPVAIATIQADASARRAVVNPARVGRWSGASQRLRTKANPTLARARTTAATTIDTRPNPPTCATTFTR